jgi:hypothetical protein
MPSVFYGHGMTFSRPTGCGTGLARKRRQDAIRVSRQWFPKRDVAGAYGECLINGPDRAKLQRSDADSCGDGFGFIKQSTRDFGIIR